MWRTKSCLLLLLALLLATDFANAVVGVACTAGSCDAANNEVCDLVSTVQCLCGAGYSNTAGTCNPVDCGNAPTLTDGIRTDGGGTLYTNQATYACNTGYTLANTATIQCRSNGIWDALSATCTIVDCGALNNPLNGGRTDGAVNTYLTTASFACNAGYDLNGAATTDCGADGQWTSAEPTCALKDCGNVPALTNGVRSDGGPTTFGAIATYGCNNGYTISGITTIDCQADGSWEAVGATCTIKDCNTAPALTNGARSDGGTTTFGSTATYTCNTGYDIGGDTDIQCQSDGTWETVAATCSIKDCGVIPTLTNGGRTDGGVTTFGATATYGCDAGYTIGGDVDIDCLSSGNWETLGATCTINDCGVATSMTNGARSGGVATTFGTTATYACNAGYDINGVANIQCQANANWETLVATCDPKDCGTAPLLTNGARSDGGLTIFDTTASYACNAGYDIGGVTTIQCQPDGTWGALGATCTIKDCGTVPTLGNGARSDAGLTTFGATATFACDAGYTISGTVTVDCLDTGSWETIGATCTIKDCGTVPTLTNGARSDTGGTTFGDTATYVCSAGYDIGGTTTVQCLDDGSWATLGATCTAKDCGAVPTLTNGARSDGGTTTFGSTATYACDLGYDISGVVTIDCQTDGSWEAVGATCTAKDCGAVPTLTNGARSDGGTTTFGSTATYACNAGYDISGVLTVDCQTDGSWEAVGATCTAKDCGTVPVLTNGARTDLLGTTFGTTATYACDPGYDISGVATINCQTDGTWQTLAATCTIQDCGTIPTLTNGLRTDGGGTTYNSLATYACNPGYTVGGDTNILCQAGPAWEALLTTCTIKDCGNHPALANGDRTDGGLTTYAATATYSCDTGYDISGTTTIQCKADGSWEALAATCTIKDCGTVPILGNGARSGTGLTTFGTTATFACDPGYTISGIVTVDCLSTGIWETLGATCTIKDCGSIPALANGIRSDGGLTTFEAVATYSCNTGYDLGGDVNVECMADGSWDTFGATCTIKDCGVAPTIADGSRSNPVDGNTYTTVATYACNTGYTISVTTSIICQADGTWATSLPTCTIVDCGTAPVISDGVRNDAGPDTYNTVATYACNTGYTISSVTTMTCQAGGTWGTTQPTCTINDCGTAPVISNGGRNPAGLTTYNEVATYTCDAGYTISALTTVTCQADGTWVITLPVCTIKDCGIIPTLTNGARSGVGLTTYSTTATYACNIGYAISGDVDILCQADGTWETLGALCTIKSCPAVSNPTNGAVDQSGGITHGSTVSYTCSEGYTLNGAVSVNCVDGAWDATTPTCDFNTCPTTPTTPTNGKFDLVESTGTFTCNSGFQLVGATTTICQGDGTWSANEPTCVLLCQFLTAPENGGVTIAGAVATFTCHLGFVLSDTSSRLCQDSGVWIPSVFPTCNLVCPAKANPTNGAVTMTGADAMFTCNAGYTLVGSSTITCQASGSWTEASPTCSFACPAQSNPADGFVSTTGDRATFTCNSGFVLIGNTAITCSSTNSQWSGSSPTCAFACSEQNTPSNGLVSRTGATATFSCDSGFTLDTGNANTMVCQSDGSWIPSTSPTCVLACAAQSNPTNGAVTMAANVATFTCNAGFVLNGVVSSTCATVGTWSSPSPTCDLECTAITAPLYGSMGVTGAIHSFTCPTGFTLSGSSSITCLTGGSWSGTVPTCDPSTTYNGICTVSGQCVTTAATCRDDGSGTSKCLCSSSGQTYYSSTDSCTSDCGSPPALTNGQVTTADGTGEGETAVYTCDTGYTMSGTPSRICLSTGAWGGTTPSCIPGCSTLNPPDNGNAVNTDEGLAYGHTAYYSCQSGYGIVGTATRICQSGGTWSGLTPECKIECGSLASPSHGVVDLSEGLYEGQSASFVCDAGYALLGNPTRECKDTGLWDGGQPICIFAIVPDAMLIFAVLCIVLTLIDIFILVLFIKYKCCTNDDEEKEEEEKPEEKPEEKKPEILPPKPHRPRKVQKLPERKEENPTDTMEITDERHVEHPPPSFQTNDERRLSYKGRVAKVGPEKTKATIPAMVKNGFLNNRSMLKGKEDEKKDLSRSLPSLKKENGFLKKPPVAPNKTPKRPPKTPTMDLPKFQNETTPFVPLVTSVPPITTFDPHTDDKKEELLMSGVVTPVEEPQKEVEKPQPVEPKRSPSPELDLISLGHLQNPTLYSDDDEIDFEGPTEPAKPHENPATSLRGRVPLNGVKEAPENVEGERFLNDDTRRRMKATINDYKPTYLQ